MGKNKGIFILIGALIVLIIVFVGFYFSNQGVSEELLAKEQELKSIEGMAKKIDKLKEMQSSSGDQYGNLMNKFLDKNQIYTDFSTGMEGLISGYSERYDPPNLDRQPIEMEGYSEQRLSLGLTTNYARLKELMERIENFNWILSCINMDMNLNPAKPPLIEVRMTLTAYMLMAEDEGT